MKRPELVPGTYHLVCDRTGFRLPNTMIVREWDNYMVWDKVYEPRQPQDYLRGIKDNMTVPIARPMVEPTFLETNAVQPGDL